MALEPTASESNDVDNLSNFGDLNFMKPMITAPALAPSEPKPIAEAQSNDRDILANIARLVMIARDLEPDFPLAAQRQLAAIEWTGQGDRQGAGLAPHALGIN